MAVTADQDLVRSLNDLIALDADASAAFDSALSRLSDAAAKMALAQFKADHDRHVDDLTRLVRELGGQPRRPGDTVQMLTQGQVVLRSITGDQGVMSAMKANEDQTNAYYEAAASEEGLPKDVRELLERNLADERRHRQWILDWLDRAH